METESELFRNETEGGSHESWQGVPGLTEYNHITRVRADRINRWLGPDGAAVATEKFDWNRSFSPVIEQLRRVKEAELTEQKQAIANEQGKDLSDVMTRAEIARQVNEEISDMFDNVNVLYNTLNKYRDRLEIITGKIPDTFQNIAGVKGADNYFLVQGGTREENEKQIFDSFKSLNNAGGNTRYDPIYSHSGGAIEGHGDKDFFGWKLTVDNGDLGHQEFVFVWNPDQTNDNDDSNDDDGEKNEKEDTL